MEAPLKKGRYLLPILITAAAITAAGLWFHQNFFRILPLYVSLFVMILSAQVNRYAFLLGGLNSILYAAAYFVYGLYGMAAYALLVSFPIQIVSFLRWKKHAYRSSVELKKLTGKQRVLAVAGFTGIWVLLYLILKQAGAAYVLLDNTVTLFGICISFLQMFAFLEYTYRMIPSGLVTLALSIRMLPEHPEQIAYLIYSIYSLICVTVQLVNARKLYRLQQGGTKEELSCE